MAMTDESAAAAELHLQDYRALIWDRIQSAMVRPFRMERWRMPRS